MTAGDEIVAYVLVMMPHQWYISNSFNLAGQRHISNGAIAGIAVGVIAAAGVAIACALLILQKKRKQKLSQVRNKYTIQKLHDRDALQSNLHMHLCVQAWARPL